MFSQIIQLILLTFIPFLELRFSIPYGINILELPVTIVFLVCVLTNMLLGPIVYILIDKLTDFALKFSLFAKPYNLIIVRTQKRIHKYIDKYGWIGLALFIGVPLPGSGSYTGAIAANIIGMDFRRFVVANIIGAIIAGTIMTLFSVGVLNFIF
jgi:uncharacterized membrane protein